MLLVRGGQSALKTYLCVGSTKIRILRYFEGKNIFADLNYGNVQMPYATWAGYSKAFEGGLLALRGQRLAYPKLFKGRAGMN